MKITRKKIKKILITLGITTLCNGTILVSAGSNVFADSRANELAKRYSDAGKLTEWYGLRYTATFKGKVPEEVYQTDAYSKPNMEPDSRIIPGDGNEVESFEYTDKTGKHNDRDSYTQDKYGEYDNNTKILVGLNMKTDKYECYKKTWDGTAYRHFKNRSANIYVKNKELLPVIKKAAKSWSPVFKFKFVKSSKHASLHSSKYANIVFYGEPNSKDEEKLTTARQVEEPKDAVKSGMNKYNDYGGGRVINYKLLKKDKKANTYAYSMLVTGLMTGDADLSKSEAKKIGGWVPSKKEVRKNGRINYYNAIIGEKRSKTQQVAAANRLLAMMIGLDPTIDSEDGNGNGVLTNNKFTHPTQTDFDTVDWLYKHLYTGKNNIY